MKERILTCYFPTTVAIVDDDANYITGITSKLDVSQAVYQFYDSAWAALKVLKTYQANNFTHRCLPEPLTSERAGDLETKIRSLYHEIYNPQRFRQVSVMVVDYAMPGMTGIELCEQLAHQPFKTLLLTGKADEQIVFKAFNEGRIHKYVRKDSTNFEEELNQAIRELQRSYFADMSSVVVNSIIREPEFGFAGVEDPVFIEFANKMCQENPTVEFHMTNPQGSFLLLDKDGKASWLAVADAEQMRMYSELAEDVSAPGAILAALQHKRMVPYFYSEKDFAVSPVAWQPFLHPAKTLQGEKDTYYYAHIQGPDADHLDRKKMVSYQAFLDTL